VTRGVIQAMLLVLLSGSSACFSYVSVPVTAVAPKEEVRVTITNDAGARLAKELGVYTTTLDGEFAAHGDSVSVTVPIVREYRGQMLEGANQSLFLGRSEVVDVRQRKFSRSRSALTTVGVVVGFVAMTKAIIAIADPNPDSDGLPPPPPPGMARVPVRRPVPLIRVHFP
jgi:hypothetical protein